MYYVYQGDRAYKNLKMGKAIKFYNQGLDLFPGHYSAWYNLGNIYVAYEDYYSALHAYSQAFKYNPKMMIARMNYGIISSEKLGNFDAAIDQYDKIVETNRYLVSIPYVYNNKTTSSENKAIAYYNKGVTYRMKYMYSNDNWEVKRTYLSSAINSYKKSLQINPKSYDTLFNLGLAYHLAGDYNNAGKNYCKAIKIAPTNYEAHYNLAVLLRRMKHYNEAYEEIDKASTLISALSDNSSMQMYASMIMSDIMKDVYQNEEYIASLNKAIAEEKSKNKKHISKKEKTEKKDKVILHKGKIRLGDKADVPVEMKNFAKCPSLSLFENIDD